MTHYSIYSDGIPDFLRQAADAPVLARLRDVGMNCGCEYTAFPRFRGLSRYSRFDHSLGVALIVWRFTRDPAQALAGLLHDVATPVFAHVVDFMRGDYLAQEATEAGTTAMIEGSPELQALLRGLGLSTCDVCDYHRYPIADNDAPRLSADRLEYTLGNCVNYGIRDLETVARYYADLAVGRDEDGRDELAFQSADLAADFADAALACSRIYVSDEDRYAMQMLSEVLKRAVALGVLDEASLYATEPEVIARLLNDPRTAGLWRGFVGLNRTEIASSPEGPGQWRRIFAKKRRIDPWCWGKGGSARCPRPSRGRWKGLWKPARIIGCADEQKSKKGLSRKVGDCQLPPSACGAALDSQNRVSAVRPQANQLCRRQSCLGLPPPSEREAKDSPSDTQMAPPRGGCHAQRDWGSSLDSQRKSEEPLKTTANSALRVHFQCPDSLKKGQQFLTVDSSLSERV